MVIGGIIGELLRLDDRFSGLGDTVKKKIGNSNVLFTDGLMTATLIFCVGSMAIVGAL